LTKTCPVIYAFVVIPAKAGIQHSARGWMPACAGMTRKTLVMICSKLSNALFPGSNPTGISRPKTL
jgi:hypothetical protein